MRELLRKRYGVTTEQQEYQQNAASRDGRIANGDEEGVGRADHGNGIILCGATRGRDQIFGRIG